MIELEPIHQSLKQINNKINNIKFHMQVFLLVTVVYESIYPAFKCRITMMINCMSTVAYPEVDQLN